LWYNKFLFRFFQQSRHVVPHFQWMKLRYGHCFWFVKNISVPNRNWHCCREKSVCLFFE
jgi:predicted GNAT superfamily acetyltransferase